MMISVRVDDGVISALDGFGGSRSDHVRAALRSYVLGAAVRSEKKSDGLALEDRIERATEALDAKYPKKAVSDDREVLLALVKKKALSERQAMEALGWMELRVSKVAGKLSGSGLIRYRDGLMEAV